MILSGIQSYFPLGLCTTDIPRGFQPNFPPGSCYKAIPRGNRYGFHARNGNSEHKGRESQ